MPVQGDTGGPKTRKVYPEAGIEPKALPEAKGANKTYGKGPVSVYVAPGVAPEPFKRAISMWNKAMGGTLFRVVTDISKADIVMSLSKAQVTQGGTEAGGVGSPAGFDGNKQGLVFLNPDYFSVQAWEHTLPLAHDKAEYVKQSSQVVAHELGHALGLAHPGTNDNPYDYSQAGYGTMTSGLMGSAGFSFDPEKFKSYPGSGITQSELDAVRKLRGLGPANPLPVAPKLPEGFFAAHADPPPSTTINIGTHPHQTTTDHPTTDHPTTDHPTSSTPTAPKVDPIVAEKESLFQSIYVQLWGEPATKAYLEQAAKSGLNTWEFQAHEMAKPEWADTKAYTDKATSIADLVASLGVGGHPGRKKGK